MEALLIGETSRHRGALTDLALELASKAAGFRRSPAGKSADFARRSPTSDKLLPQQPHRHARRIVSALTDRGVLTADGSRAPLRLVFPGGLVSRWMPGLFPERVVI